MKNIAHVTGGPDIRNLSAHGRRRYRCEDEAIYEIVNVDSVAHPHVSIRQNHVTENQTFSGRIRPRNTIRTIDDSWLHDRGGHTTVLNRLKNDLFKIELGVDVYTRAIAIWRFFRKRAIRERIVDRERADVDETLD